MRHKYKAAAAAAIIILTCTFLAASLSCACAGRHTVSQSDIPASEPQEDTRVSNGLRFSLGRYDMTVGEMQRLCVCYDNGAQADTAAISWSCSDESVAVIDSLGSVTAVGYGQAVLYARDGEKSASVAVTVGGDIVEQSISAISLLATAAGSDTNYIDACVLYEQLGRCPAIDRTQQLHALLGEILAYSYGSGDSAALDAAISASGFSRPVCKTAAAGCWAKYEAQQYDAVLSFAGDVTLAKFNGSSGAGTFPAIYARSASKTYPFDRTRTIFSCDKLTAVNFEGTLTSRSVHSEKPFFFAGEPEYADILSASGIEAANLGNNHSGDYLDGGFDDTVSSLNGAGISVFYPDNPHTARISTAAGTVNVCFISDVCIGAQAMPEKQLERLLSTVRKAAEQPDTIVIVNLHWGVELGLTPEGWQTDAAHAIADAGAGLIIGHHPHVLQGVESYNGCIIAYSLGNFAFGGNSTAANPETVILRAHITHENGAPVMSGVSFVPCFTTSSGSSANNYQPVICFGNDAEKVINTLITRSGKLACGISRADYPQI